jgi:fructose-1,6-bisphosphatase/inositol monophosphatase family enzyme
VDGYFEAGVFRWDTDAAGLIVRRAGGRAEPLLALEGHRHCYIASNGKIHAALKRLLLPVLPRG